MNGPPLALWLFHCGLVSSAQLISQAQGLIDHSQKMTTAAMHMADMNV